MNLELIMQGAKQAQKTSLGAAGIAAGTSVANSLIDQAFAEFNRQRNFHWNEKAADAADKRQRKQYEDLYSPKAMLEQYRAAGLSPSMMMSSGAPAVGSSSANGNLAGGVSGPYPAAGIMNPQDMANLALTSAQIRNLDEDTISKDLQNQINELKTSTYKKQWELLNSFGFGDENGTHSISKIANESENFEQFAKKISEIYDSMNPEIGNYLYTEMGQRDLRTIYQANKEFSNDIAVLANSKENADLLLNITKLLNNNEFAKLSANAQKQQLRQAIELAKLGEKQKGAINRLIDKMGDSTWADLTLVFLMIIGQYSHMNLNFGAHATNVIK